MCIKREREKKRDQINKGWRGRESERERVKPFYPFLHTLLHDVIIIRRVSE